MALADTIREVRSKRENGEFPSLSSFSPIQPNQPVDLAGTIKQVRQERSTLQQITKTDPFVEGQDVVSRTIQSAALDIPKAFATALRIITEPRKPNEKFSRYFPNISTERTEPLSRPDKLLGIDISFLNKIEDNFKRIVAEPLNRKSLDIIEILNKKQQEIIKPIFDEKPGLSNWKEYTNIVVSGSVSFGEAIGLSLITKNSAIGAGFLSSVESTDVYNRARTEGIDHSTALKSAIESGAGTFLLEKIGLDYLFSLGGASRLASALKSSIFETGQEELQTVWQNIVRKKNVDRTQKIFEGWYETAIGISLPSFFAGLFIPGISFKTRQEIVGDMANEAGVSPQQAGNAFMEMAGIARKSLEQFKEQAKKFTPGLTIEEQPENIRETIRKIIAERTFEKKIEQPVAKAVDATFDEETSSSGFHKQFSQEFNGIEPSWAIVYKGDVPEELKTSAEEAGLKINRREAPKGTGNFITDIYLPDIKQSETAKATEIFNNFAELYNQKKETTSVKAENAFQETEAGVLMELEISQKGERYGFETGEGKVMESTFPKFVPKELRSKELFDKIIELNIQGKKPKGVRQVKLMDIISQEIINRMDINLADEKVAHEFLTQLAEKTEKEENEFLKELEKNIATAIKEKRFTVKQVVQKMETAEKKGFKKGAKETRENILTQLRETQQNTDQVKKDIVDFAKENLPPKERGQLLSVVQNSKTQRDLTKAFGKIYRIYEQSTRVTLKQEIKNVYERLIDSPSVAIEYKAKAKEIVPFLGSEKMLEKARGFAKFIETQKDNELPLRLAKLLEISNKQTIEEIPVRQLEAILQELRLLEQLGRLKDCLKVKN